MIVGPSSANEARRALDHLEAGIGGAVARYPAKRGATSRRYATDQEGISGDFSANDPR